MRFTSEVPSPSFPEGKYAEITCNLNRVMFQPRETLDVAGRTMASVRDALTVCVLTLSSTPGTFPAWSAMP
jgi:hypothetical protein